MESTDRYGRVRAGGMHGVHKGGIWGEMGVYKGKLGKCGCMGYMVI